MNELTPVGDVCDLCQCSVSVCISVPSRMRVRISQCYQAMLRKVAVHWLMENYLADRYGCYLFYIYFSFVYLYYCLQCFDTVGWAAGRASSLYKN